MSNKLKSKKGVVSSSAGNIDNDQFAKYSRAPFFEEKDKKAAAFLKKHPVPKKLLK